MRLGHVSDRRLKELRNQGLLYEDLIGKLELCDHYIIGKQTRLKFIIGIHISNGTLDYVHSNVWGPTRVNSHGGNRHFITIIDDFSRKVWLYLMKHFLNSKSGKHCWRSNSVEKSRNLGQTMVLSISMMS